MLPVDDPGGGPVVLVVRAFPRPIAAADAIAMQRTFEKHLKRRNLPAAAGLLDTGCRRLWWLVRTRDRRAVEQLLEESGLLPATIWHGEATACRNDVTTSVLLEHDGRSTAVSRPVSEHLRCLCLATHGVMPTCTISSADGRHAVSLFHAPDGESVRQTQHNAGVPAGEVWSVAPIGHLRRQPTR